MKGGRKDGVLATYSGWRWIIIGVVSRALFHSKALKFIAYLSNRFQLRRREDKRLIFPFLQRASERTIQILAYHRVNDDRDPFFPAVPTQIFARRMRYLAANYRILALEEAVQRIQKRDIPDNALVVTFDDGYRDNYTQAFPILKELSIPATIFLATDAIDSRAVLWHDRVFSAFRDSGCPVLKQFGRLQQDYRLDSIEKKLAAQRVVLEFLWSLSDLERELWIDRLVEQLGVSEQTVEWEMLTWREIKVMHCSGITFGSHTLSHPVLSKIPVAQVKKEVIDSKRIIEANLGVTVKSFAYPVGRENDWSMLTKAILKEAGYICALTTIPGANGCSQDLFEMRRGGPWQTSLPSFALKLQWDKIQSV